MKYELILFKKNIWSFVISILYTIGYAILKLRFHVEMPLDNYFLSLNPILIWLLVTNIYMFDTENNMLQKLILNNTKRNKIFLLKFISCIIGTFYLLIPQLLVGFAIHSEANIPLKPMQNILLFSLLMAMVMGCIMFFLAMTVGNLVGMVALFVYTLPYTYAALGVIATKLNMVNIKVHVLFDMLDMYYRVEFSLGRFVEIVVFCLVLNTVSFYLCNKKDLKNGKA